MNKDLLRISKLPPEIQQIELAAFLSKEFKKHQVVLTVVGGAAVQYYTSAQYVTADLDMVLSGDTKEINEEVMGKLGFKRTTMYRHFEHPDLPFVVEFPPSPIEVGSRIINQVNMIKFGSLEARVIRVEDIIMDRIIAAVEWKDVPSMEQAKLLYLKNKRMIDQDYLTQFAKEEGYLKTLKEVMKVIEEF